MAHALRYYKEIQQDNGQIIRLEIHKKDSTLPAVEIGRVLQALHLDIQGGADTIDAPIVKTSLTMAFVDAPDLEAGKKCGNWEEFYTPDSTMWKVVLKADGKTIWGGYVTPDSYQEDLRYRGSVTIIARDNIGHMQDFPFDMEGNADGMVTLEQLVNEAWAKIESPMRLDWWHEEQEAMYLMCEGNDAPSTYMNVSAFEDMNFFDAVEKALYSYGLVMRYTGSNRVTIMSLRDLPYQGKSGAPRAIEPTFIAHAQRELAPAARRIEESVKYEDVEAVQPQVKPSDFSGVSDSYAYEFGHPNGATLETAPVHNIINTDERNGWANMPGKTLFFNAGLYELSNFDKIQPYADIMHRYMYIAVNNVQNISLDNVERFVSYGRNMLYQDFGFSLNLGILIEWSGALVLSKVTGYTLSGITYAVGCEYEGDIIYYAGDGKWQDSVCEITQEISGNEENNTIDISVLVDRTKSYKTATFILYIRRISYTRQGDLASGRGLYAAVQSLSITHNNALLSDNTVNTVYNNDNNVIISREPEIAPALNSVILPSVIKNGIFVKSGNAYLPAKGWAWSGGTPQQMAVYNHLQLLCYHSKPNNIISGDIAYADFAEMEAIYEWGGANHLLVSGSYNFLNGRIESAVLREFKFYTDMWSDVSGTSLPETEQNNRTTAESGSGAAKASTYSNETTVNIGGSGGGGGTGGSSTLAGLLDVQVSSPSNGQALVYDSVSGMWMNKTIEKGDKVTSSAIISALGYTPLNADSFTKANLGLGNVDNIAANKYFTALSSGTTNAVSMTIGGVTKNITADALKTSLGLAGLAYQASVPAALGYTPFDKANFTKSNIKSTLGISDWALEANKPSYGKSDVGLDKVDNIAAGDYFTELSSDTTNAISATIGGVTKNITATKLKTSLGLGAFAYLSEIPFTSITDVVVSNPSSGQLLSYDATRRRWVNKTFDLGEHISAGIIVDTLGYEPFDSDAFTKSNIKNALGIADWALAANKPSYTWTEIGSRPTALSAFTNDLGLGSLAYKSSLVASDIPSLPWSKITSGKPTTLSGYGITDGLVYSDYINLASAYRHIGYGYTSIGWKTSGPAAVFGTALYNLRIQCAISTSDAPRTYISQMHNGEAKGWAELVTYEGAAGKDFEAQRYKIGETYVLNRSGNDTFLNYGNRATGGLYLYGTGFYFSQNGTSTPFKIATDGTVSIHDIALTKGTSNSLKAVAYETFQYFSGGKLIMHRNEGAAGTYINYGGRTEGLTLYGSAMSFNIGDTGAALLLSANKDASFAANLTVAGNMYSKNYPAGKALSQDPTSAFISTIFDADAVSDSSYRMKILRSGSAYDRFNAAYSPVVAFKTGDTHGFVSFGYNAAGKAHCYIGGGSADKINWSGKLFHDNMDLIPKDDGAFSLGNSDKRWGTLNVVNVSADGIYGYIPEGGTYQRYRLLSSGDRMYLQVGAQDGIATTGKLTICGINIATLLDLAIYSQQTSFSGAVQVNGTSQFVSLATFDKGIKIGDATLTWDASAGMLKIDKGVYSEGAITAKKKA